VTYSPEAPEILVIGDPRLREPSVAVEAVDRDELARIAAALAERVRSWGSAGRSPRRRWECRGGS